MITLDDAKEIAASKQAPKVTERSIKDKIKDVQFFHHDVLTIAIITMSNGFMVLGKSAPASLANYDQDVGDRFAFDDAFKQLWPLEGYLLREKLSQQEV